MNPTMKTVVRQVNASGSTHFFVWTMVVLLALSWGGPAWGRNRADPPALSAVAAGNHVAAARVAGPEVWLCAGERVADLLRPEAQWPFVRRRLAGIKLYVDQINQAPPEQLAALVRLVQENRYQVAVELGGCLDFAPMDDTAGEWSARHELAKIAKFYAAGGQVDFLDLDGPIRRLMHPEKRPDGRRFDSIEQAADELVDALRLHTQAHPKTRFWLLSNFPNWGWRGDVSYHARGPQRQDYGDDDTAVRMVLRKLGAAGIPLAGITVDNPYDYLVGEHQSVNLRDPKSVDWLKRVRSYEDFARERGLEFNLIVNSERGGHESDERFCRETLQMVDLYRRAGGRPTRWFVQSWYPHPEQMTPETAPHSMTALVKAVIEQVGPDVATPSGGRIVLQPQPGAMQVTARVPGLDNQVFALGIPETIGCREAMLVNFPEAKIEWQRPDADGAVTCSWGPGGRISYSLRLTPAADYVDVEMTVRNHTEFLWHDVFAFNCLNPIQAPVFQDWKLERTYMSKQGKPFCLGQTTRVKGHMPTVGFYLPERVKAGEESVFVRGFGATSPDRTDGSWIVTLSEPAGAFLAATAMEAAFLFDNLDRCCLHAAPSFGDIGPGEGSTTVSRLYLARGTLDEFLNRQDADRPELSARQKWARPVAGVKKTKPHGRMEEMSPDEPDKPSFEQYLRESAVPKEVIDRFLEGPSWAQYDPELGYVLGNYLPQDGMDKSATISTVQANGARTSFLYAGKKCRINTYGDSFTQCHQVSDGETWQEYLAGHLGEPVRNFGMGGYGVYQAYRRMVREERTEHGAPYVIFYLWGDDHIRSLLRCRHALIFRWWNDQGGRAFHNNFWPNLEMDLKTGRFIGHYNPSGNHFFAYSIKNQVVDWLDPKPITYRKLDPQSVDFTGYLQDSH